MIAYYRTVAFDDLNVFFQEAGSADAPALLSLHGFPTSTHTFFVPAGAKAFTRDIPDTEVHLLKAEHFALESQGPEIAAIIRGFLVRN
jgi:pimeloyl-ACP methyl ester carboxylesterase